MKTSTPLDKPDSKPSSRQIDRAYDKLIHWLYEKPDDRRARLYAEKLESLLDSAIPGSRGDIFVAECPVAHS